MTHVAPVRRAASTEGRGLRALRPPDAPAHPANLERLLTAAEVAQVLGVRPKRVYELGIPAVRLSEKTVRWRHSAVQTWLDARTEGGPR
jgi:predicted DNA-binding transcriptional regulator AlpA